MEFVRRWICTASRLAFAVAHYGNVQEALDYLEQDFSQRENKAVIAALAANLREIGPLDGQSAAEELASLAVRWLEVFDDKLPRRANNSSRCRIGSTCIEPDYNNLVSDLHVWYCSFIEPITDCHVTKFLEIGRPGGRAQDLADDPATAELSSVKNLARYHANNKNITCKECSRIGDAVVALEQAPSFTLIHTDDSFNHFCRKLNHKNTQIDAVRAFDKDLRDKLTGKRAVEGEVAGDDGA